MSDLLILSFDNPREASRAQRLALELQRRDILGPGRIVQIRHQRGRTELLDQPPAPEMRWSGLADVWIALSRLGSLVLRSNPLARTAGEALEDALREGADDAWMHHVGAGLPRGHAALVVTVARIEIRPLTSALVEAGLRGQVLQTSLTREDEQRLRVALMGQF